MSITQLLDNKGKLKNTALPLRHKRLMALRSIFINNGERRQIRTQPYERDHKSGYMLMNEEQDVC